MVLPLRNKTNTTTRGNNKQPTDHSGGVSFTAAAPTTEKKKALPRTPHPNKKQRRDDNKNNTTTEPYPRTPFPTKQRDDDNRKNMDEEQQPMMMKSHHEPSMMNDDTVVHNDNNDDALVHHQDKNDNVPLEDDDDKPMVEDTINWSEFEQHEPAATDIPIFLEARLRREAANKQFGAALDACHEALQEATQAVLNVAVEYYQATQEKLDDLEGDITEHFQHNHETRAVMEQRLQETAQQTQGLIAQVFQKLSHPFGGAAPGEQQQQE